MVTNGNTSGKAAALSKFIWNFHVVDSFIRIVRHAAIEQSQMGIRRSCEIMTFSNWDVSVLWRPRISLLTFCIVRRLNNNSETLLNIWRENWRKIDDGCESRTKISCSWCNFHNRVSPKNHKLKASAYLVCQSIADCAMKAAASEFVVRLVIH